MHGLLESGVLTGRPLLARDVQTYRLCEDLTELLIYFMLIFSPWAFGTTEPWSVWTMNICGYSLGILMLIKLTIRWLKGYRPGKWGEELGKAESGKARKREILPGTKLDPTITRDAPETNDHGPRTTGHGPRKGSTSALLTRALAALTLTLLAYCFTAA